jgi:hypothetical protein
MNSDSHRGVIIERVLEKGTWEQLHGLFARYGEATVIAWVRKRVRVYIPDTDSA